MGSETKVNFSSTKLYYIFTNKNFTPFDMRNKNLWALSLWLLQSNTKNILLIFYCTEMVLAGACNC